MRVGLTLYLIKVLRELELSQATNSNAHSLGEITGGATYFIRSFIDIWVKSVDRKQNRECSLRMFASNVNCI